MRVTTQAGNVPAKQPGDVNTWQSAKADICLLAVQSRYFLARDALLNTLWSQTNPPLATQSLNNLVYSLHKLLGDAIGGRAPVVHTCGCSQTNVKASVGSDVTRFDALADAGDLCTSAKSSL